LPVPVSGKPCQIRRHTVTDDFCQHLKTWIFRQYCYTLISSAELLSLSNHLLTGEADTIPTDSVPTDAIPTIIRSQDDPVQYRNSRNWEKIGGGRGVACIESTALIEAPRGVGPEDGILVGYGVPPPPQKLQRTSNSIVLPLIFRIWIVAFQAVLAIGLFNGSQPPDVHTPDCGLSE